MNKVELFGRLTKDPEMRSTAGAEPVSVARFTLAVNRRKKGEADFISCVAFGKTAEVIGKYTQKGARVTIAGRIQTGSYEKDGRKVYTTDVVAEDVDIIDWNNAEAAKDGDDWYKVDDGITEELPFV